jgi:hypothetical protein
MPFELRGALNKPKGERSRGRLYLITEKGR